MDNAAAILIWAVPPEGVECALRAVLLDNDAHRVCKADGVVRCVWGQEEHLAFGNVDVPEDLPAAAARVVARKALDLDDFEKHPARILEEPLRSSVDVVVAPGVGPADNHHRHTRVVVNAKVANWRLKEV